MIFERGTLVALFSSSYASLSEERIASDRICDVITRRSQVESEIILAINLAKDIARDIIIIIDRWKTFRLFSCQSISEISDEKQPMRRFVAQKFLD